MRIFIEPTEPLLFRAGKPFTAGENNFAESMFPPTPETLQGALRAMIATQWGLEFAKTSGTDALFSQPEVVELIGKRDGDRNTYGRFRVTGLALGFYDTETQQVCRLFPAPTHLIQVTVKDGQTEITTTMRLSPTPIAQELSNHPVGTQLLLPDLGQKKTAGKSEPLPGWLTPSGLQHALSKTGFSGSDETREDEKRKWFVPVHKVFLREARLGIGMNNTTKTTEDGYLYQTHMIRMQPRYGFVVDIALGEKQYGECALPASEQCTGRLEIPPELNFLKEGWLTLGGEQRTAHFRVLQPDECAPEHGISQTAAGRLLYFATPTYFQDGWLPAHTQIFGKSPLAAAINHYQPIGGWLLSPGNAGGMSKAIRRCIPAGSVYYFTDSIEATQPLTEYGWQIGYGIAYTGEW